LFEEHFLFFSHSQSLIVQTTNDVLLEDKGLKIFQNSSSKLVETAAMKKISKVLGAKYMKLIKLFTTRISPCFSTFNPGLVFSVLNDQDSKLSQFN
jgi:hypothetical protein